MLYTPNKALSDVISVCNCPDNVFISHEKIIMDSLTLPEDTDWITWLKALRLAAFFNQSGRCVCGNGLKNDTQLHHALLSRGDLVGLNYREKNIVLHHTYNCILCHSSCHEKITRKASLEFLKTVYGNSVLEWYESIPKKYMRGRRGLE